jgi:hypothetical protein
MYWSARADQYIMRRFFLRVVRARGALPSLCSLGTHMSVRLSVCMSVCLSVCLRHSSNRASCDDTHPPPRTYISRASVCALSVSVSLLILLQARVCLPKPLTTCRGYSSTRTRVNER